MNKAQFEIQFNWIFVLAVGAIILIFFSVVMLKQKSASEQTTNLFVLKNLEAIMAGAEVSAGTVNFVDMPKIEVNFECNRYSIGDASKRFEIMSVFTPSKIKSNKMITWTLAWNVPYRVTNFLYLTSPNIRYVLIGENELAVSVNKTMPKELNKELIRFSDINNIKNKNDAQVRFIFFNINPVLPNEFIKMSDKDVSALKVTGDDENTGTIEFYKKEGTIFTNKKTSYYLKEPSLIGAVFTDNIEMYECVMKNAFKKLNIVTEVYKKKIEDLRNIYTSQGDRCAAYYDLQYINTISSAASPNFNFPQISAIDTNSILLENQNKQAQLYSCALIY